MIHADPTKGQSSEEFFHYDPMGVVDFRPGAPNNHNKPCTQIYGQPGLGQAGYSFQEMGSQRGTIFIYQLYRDSTQGQIVV